MASRRNQSSKQMSKNHMKKKAGRSKRYKEESKTQNASTATAGTSNNSMKKLSSSSESKEKESPTTASSRGILILSFIALISLLGNVFQFYDLGGLYWNSSSPSSSSSSSSLVFATKEIASDAGSVATKKLSAKMEVPICTAKQLPIIQQQLPSSACQKYQNQPWIKGGLCSFSFATRCVEPIWLTDYYNKYFHSHDDDDNDSKLVFSDSTHTTITKGRLPPQRTAIYVGCNKGLDAINTLRMLSNNAKYDKLQWLRALLGNQQFDPKGAGSCGQEDPNEQYEILDDGSRDNTHQFDAIVHCIEPLPTNSHGLTKDANLLQIHDAFRVHPMAVSDSNGVVQFPSVAKIGEERVGIGQCDSKKRNNVKCEDVPLRTLDTFGEETNLLVKNKNETTNSDINDVIVDFLSIDAEGYDALILKGATQLLSKVKYLEFEYNWKGAWSDVSLKTLIHDLYHQHRFVCYWAGSFGNIWRISDTCWLEYYEIKIWSNIACVQPQISSKLYEIMEDYFQQTLAKGTTTVYDTFETAKTDGRRSRNSSST